METGNKKLRKYFLETLSPDECEEIELQIISEADFAGELDAAETELMEDYLENALGSEEEKLFKTNFLVTQERQERLEFLKSLRHFAQNTQQDSIIKENQPSFFESLKTYFSPRRIAFGFGIIILVLVLGLIWRAFLPVNNLNTDIAAINRRDLSNLDEFRNSTNLSLSPGNLRSGGNNNNLEIQKITDKVLLRLALPPKTPLNSIFQVTLLQGKNTVFTIEKTRIYGNEEGQEIRLIIPAVILKKGEYEIELQKESSKINYAFSIQ